MRVCECAQSYVRFVGFQAHILLSFNASASMGFCVVGGEGGGTLEYFGT